MLLHCSPQENMELVPIIISRLCLSTWVGTFIFRRREWVLWRKIKGSSTDDAPPHPTQSLCANRSKLRPLCRFPDAESLQRAAITLLQQHLPAFRVALYAFVCLLSPLLDFRPLYVWFILLPLTVCAGVGHYGSHQKCVWTAGLSHRRGLRRHRISDSCVVGLCFSNCCSKGELMFLLMILTTCLKFVFKVEDHKCGYAIAQTWEFANDL